MPRTPANTIIFFNLQMMFVGSIIIASFGVAGMLSAMVASSFFPSDYDEYLAKRYLTGTSVSW